MYLLLLLFGAVSTVAGVVLAASGISLHEHSFDASTGTAGIIGAVGGLLLIGLGLALRVLQRIEAALATRPTPRPAEAAEMAAAERPAETSRIRLTSKSTLSEPAAAAEKRGDALSEKLAEKISTAAQPAEDAEAPDVPTPPPIVPGADVPVADVDRARLARRRNGFAPSRITPRLDMSVRSTAAPERSAGPAFDTLWPKGPRPSRAAPSAPTHALKVPTAVPVAEAEQKSEPAVEAPAVLATDEAQVSVLKSGVVDGMAYTLYSDGSIEAQLPQGTLRFGSITELRNHIERSA